MDGVRTVVQGKKGSGADKHQLAFRCPGDLYRQLQDGTEPGSTVTTRVLRALQDQVDVETEAGERLPELRAAAILGRGSFGQVIAKLALEAIDARKRGKK